MQNKIVQLFIFTFFLIFFSNLSAQFTLNLESNDQYYIDDNKIKLEGNDTINRFRSNTYMTTKYDWGKFTMGAQFEFYEPQALLNFAPSLDGSSVGTFYVKYNDDDIGLDVTAGHLYEQFGSGLALRTWEDRQLGIANSIVGGRVVFNQKDDFFTLKALYGKQRLGFDVTDANILGTDAEIFISNLLKSENTTSSIGFSLVNKNEGTEGNANYQKNVSIYSARGGMDFGKFNFDLEYNYKTKDAIKLLDGVDSVNTFDGSAVQLNMGYSQKGFGISGNLRRVENFSFYSQREMIGNLYNEAILNYVPSLTKQFDYSLANIYVYQAQPFLTFLPQKKAGEIGSQFDLFYLIPKGSKIGGKYGTNVYLNFANWYGLKGKYRMYRNHNEYSTEFLNWGERYYTSYNIDIRRKMNKKWTSAFNYLHQYYNTYRVEETSGEVRAQTIVFDNLLKVGESASMKIELQHQWADAYHGNWAAGLWEYNFLKNWSIFVNDLWNYGNKDDEKKIHYYTTGVVFRKNKTRISAQYGRQRGGITCVGGVCRFVPESNGFSFGINTSL